ncbi:conserved hypothetical protein [Leishmania braziliensis MHOM/BR/75/M2904]|uniref:RRM domain-containing protein n=2 Tax=Leishmania braziliensis TaxID=5660 RepID=A4H661_LEIBR|nr:conserved hypothetical protein [Leishmania braziliensis MHOM/BR/75/M2904]CAJ2467861.1 unnamed protein product [Leishmania braziliensis]CAM37284.2 conserved hypothetical protein [Leishmania braziliensis MHOM/BR/75/M2904]SYZ63485.1 RNA_recognition_motif_(a.k.a._RRM [Leishmania braziliensis MHOM/BR/75/M2904]
MSRVRILNLPADCTEEQLKQHLLRTAPRDAPLLEITDVQFIRRPATALDRDHHHKQRRGCLSAVAAAKAPKMILRMAFVGFRTSAAGHFVAQYFNRSFFRSACLKVELAKGLNEVGVTLNQLRKQKKKEEEKSNNTNKAKLSSGAADGSHASGLTSSTTAGEQATTRKRARDNDREDGKDGGDTGNTTADDDLARRQREFVELRSKATEGPTWAAEVLLAPDNTPTASMGKEAERKCAMDEKTQRHRRRQKAEGHVPDVGNTDGESEVEQERWALSRQQALGEVSDMDFLARLAGAPTHNAVDAEETARREDDADVGASVSEDDGDGNIPATSTNTDSSTKSKEKEFGHVATATTHEAQEEIARASHRIRLGNIPYIATEEHLKQFATSLVGPVEAVHIPLTKDTRQNKGAAFVRFFSAEDAVRALRLCRGAILMGRLLRVSAAEEDPHSKRVMEREAALASAAAAQGTTDALSRANLSGSSQFKKQREADRRGGEAGKEGGGGQITWNTMYMNSHAAVETVAQRLGVRSEDVVGVGAKGAAVRAAIAEAYLASEVQHVLSDEGIACDVLEGATQNLLKSRSNTTILVKNLQLKDGGDAAELTKLFVRFGVLETSAFPSAGTFALFRFTHPQDARIAFMRLSYKLFKAAPLFLEWAPVGALMDDGEGSSAAATAAADLGLAVGPSSESGANADTDDAAAAAVANAVVYTLFLTNIPFQTTEDELHAFLLDACPRLARAPETLIKRLVLQQVQGRAFLTVADQSTLAYCVSKINGKILAGRTLSCVVSKQTTQLLQQARVIDTTSTAQGTTGQFSGANARDDNDDEADATKTAVLARRRGVTSSAATSSEVPPGSDPQKLIVKNLPFEATERDVRELFSAFSEIRSVRVPRKSHTFSSHRENNHRGFAFVEFLSEVEAARALETLKSTHLYGRHLVLQYAKLDG